MCICCEMMIDKQPEFGDFHRLGGMDLLRLWDVGKKRAAIFANNQIDYRSFARVTFEPSERYFPGAYTIVAECVADDFLNLPHLIKVYWDGSKLYSDVDESDFMESGADNVMDAIDERLM